MTEDTDNTGARKRPEWVDDAEDALSRAGEAVRAAWEATKETRVSALDSAKTAAKQLGEAIDRGVEAARQKWQEAQSPTEEE
ncbi:MAG: hypothetical protein L0Z49_03845 [Actinobacteria bacterium]|nr:hypothetical protein [Actinomycetota bacterium]